MRRLRRRSRGQGWRRAPFLPPYPVTMTSRMHRPTPAMAYTARAVGLRIPGAMPAYGRFAWR